MDYGATDHYIATIQRLEADRNFWMNAAEADKRKVAELTAALEKAREELRIMNRYAEMDEVTLYKETLYVDLDEDGYVAGVYAKPNQNIETFLCSKDMNSIYSQIEDAQDDQAREDTFDRRLETALFWQQNGG